MEEIYPILHNCSYFEGIPEEKYPHVLRCLQARKKSFARDSTILNIGEPSRMAGVVLQGVVELSFYDENGSLVNVNHISDSGVFGAELACSRQNASPIQLCAVTDCQILFLNFSALLDPDASACPFRQRMSANLIRDFAHQTLFLNQKLRIMGQKRLRDKIKVYLQCQKITADGTICVPFKRSELADFLYVDRSALSRELGRMREEGILSFQGQNICVLDRSFLLN